MEVLTHFGEGAAAIFRLTPLLMVLLGTAAGIMIGVMPGLSPSIGVALLLPMTFGMEPTSGLALLVSVYLAANYGGSITAIAINTPGTPGAVATTFDGYPLTRSGKPGLALGTSLVSSTAGGLVGTLILVLFSIPLARVALSFESHEYAALGVLGLTVIAALAGESPLKGFLASALGLLLTTVGFDTELPFARFTFGIDALADGIPLIPALIGLFALGEIFSRMGEQTRPRAQQDLPPQYSSELPGLGVLWKLKRVMAQSAILGTLIGAVPGAGGTIATFVSYNLARATSKEPDRFGQGALEGVAAPEASNNGSVGGALIPLLTLGIPGSASTAVLLGALMVHDLNPGPELFTAHADVAYGVFVALLLSNLVMLGLGLVGTRLWVRIIAAPRALLYPGILALSFVGSYAISQSMADVFLCLGFGILGLLLKKARVPAAPVVLGLILGRIIEENLRLSLQKGDLVDFVTRPISGGLLLLTLLAFALPAIKAALTRWTNA